MYDLALLGAGLHNSLILLALRAQRPDLRVLVIDQAPEPCGDQLWSFHHSDIAPAAWTWLRPLVEFEWPGWSVHFPHFERQFPARYYGLRSPRLRTAVRQACVGESQLLCDSPVESAGSSWVQLRDGRRYQARFVLDGRGEPDRARGSAGYQKFLGLEVRCNQAHGLSLPRLMDATVAQQDGYRFLYALPLDAHRLLLEDTVFSSSPELDEASFRQRIADYARSNDWEIAAIEREERGLLPMPWGALPPARDDGLFRSGARGGWMHAATGYSFPIAVQVAEFLRQHAGERPSRAQWDSFAHAHRRAARTYRLLNELQFRWYPPAGRRRIYERFFRMDAELILRFFAHRSTAADRLRILCGRPPQGLSLRWRLHASPALP